MKRTALFPKIHSLLLFLLGMMLMSSPSCAYMKMLPPADIDKRPPAPAAPDVDNSCWMATASNMLAGAGYGTGTTLEDRSEDIYADMVTQYGKAGSGWIDVALDWWLNSGNNIWPANPYQSVTVYGNKTRMPWVNSDGAQFIGNELRTCHFVGLSISWPATGGASGGHAITAWGDNLGNTEEIPANPTSVRITDSDRDTGGDVQAYNYDVYTNPNPGGANQGNGWYFNFDPNHPFIKHICTLAPVDDPSGNDLIQKVIGSYKILQDNINPATGLKYEVGTDVNILSYLTYVDWGENDEFTPTIVEANPRTKLDVTWDFRTNPVPQNTWVIITTEFMLPTWNSMKYENVHFTYPLQLSVTRRDFPQMKWNIHTPDASREMASKANATGGYVVGSFEIINPSASNKVIGEYRFIHQYSYIQNPEMHNLTITGENGYQLRNFRFGHSYGYMDTPELWRYKDWMTSSSEVYPLNEREIKIDIDWQGRLPYPEGEDIQGRIPNKNTNEKQVIDLNKMKKKN